MTGTTHGFKFFPKQNDLPIRSGRNSRVLRRMLEQIDRFGAQ